MTKQPKRALNLKPRPYGRDLNAPFQVRGLHGEMQQGQPGDVVVTFDPPVKAEAGELQLVVPHAVFRQLFGVVEQEKPKTTRKPTPRRRSPLNL